MPLNNRPDLLTGYPFQRLAALLDGVVPRTNAEPINLTIGEPRMAPPPVIAEKLAAHADLWGRYPPMLGTPEFRAAAAGWLRRRYALPDSWIDPDTMILPVAGTREALYLICQIAVPTDVAAIGDARPLVMMPNPAYGVYEGAAVMAGAEIRYLPATHETGFLPDLGGLDDQDLDRTAVMYLCSPSNPQGAVAGLDYWRQAVALARRHDFLLVADECYAEIYRSEPPPGVSEACMAIGGADPFDHVIAFHSLSKRSSAAGLRSGFVLGSPGLIGRFGKIRNYAMAGSPFPVLAAATALWNDDTHAAEIRDGYRQRIDAALDGLGNRIPIEAPAAGFFLWIDVGDGTDAALRIWRETAIRTLPGGFLGAGDGPDNPGHRYLRVALVETPETIHAAMNRLAAVL